MRQNRNEGSTRQDRHTVVWLSLKRQSKPLGTFQAWAESAWGLRRTLHQALEQVAGRPQKIVPRGHCSTGTVRRSGAVRFGGAACPGGIARSASTQEPNIMALQIQGHETAKESSLEFCTTQLCYPHRPVYEEPFRQGRYGNIIREKQLRGLLLKKEAGMTSLSSPHARR